VRVLARRRLEGSWDGVVNYDLAAGDAPEGTLEGVRVVFHLAGKVHADDGYAEDGNDYQTLNVDGTRRLLEAARRAGVERFIFFSSVKVMGEAADDCLDEEAPPRPSTAYGRSKLEAEHLVIDGGYVPHPCVLRLAMVYGPGAKGNLVKMVKAVRRGVFPSLAGVENRRSMVHVDDVVEAAIAAATHEASKGATYIVTDGEIYSTGEIYAAIRSALGLAAMRRSTPVTVLRMAARLGDGLERILRKRLPLNSGALEKLLGSECYKSDKIVSELGFRPRHSLAGSLPEMIAAMSGVR
jgi:UDP-glucose 4-epimerase